MTRKSLALAAAVAFLSAVFAAGCASSTSKDAPYSLTGRDTASTSSSTTARHAIDDLEARREAARGNYLQPPRTSKGDGGSPTAN